MTIQELINYLEKEIKNFEPEQMTYKYLTFILKQIHQLKTLSKDWIRANEEQIYFKEPNNAWWVEAKKLEGVLVPKQEITEEQAWYFIAKKYNQEGSYWFDARNHYLKTIEKPVIPQFVADFIEETKKQNKSLVFAITHIYGENEIGKSPDKETNKMFQWMESADNEELFARAWLDGYEIEQEPKYYVMNNKDELILARNNNSVVGIRIRHYDDLKSDLVNYYQLTEQEIKNYDPRYWAFAKPVEEVEE